MDEQSLNDLLECSVCLDRLDETSKVLPCQHTFCKRCLEEIRNSRGELRCPECRVLVHCSVDELPTNILLVRLLGGIKQPAGKSTAKSKHSSKHEASASNASGSSVAPAKSSQGRVHHIKQEGTGKPCAKALFNFDGKEPGDLTFKRDDLILLLKKIDENWYQGEVNGQVGFLPSNYIHVLIAIPTEPPQCKALYDFDLRDQDGKDCLTFSKGDIFTIIKRVDENWAEGQRGDKIGIFPLSYVELNEASCNLLGQLSINAVASFHEPPATSTNTATSTTTTTTAAAATTTTTANTSNTPSHEEQHRNKPSQKRHSFTLFPVQGSAKSNAGAKDSSRQSAEVDIGAPVLISTSNTRATTLLESKLQPPLSSSFPGAANVASNSSHGNGRLSSQQQRGSGDLLVPIPVHPHRTDQASAKDETAKSLQSVHRALYAYKPQKADELELKKGELYNVVDKCQDGWFKGVSLHDGSKGVFPGNYVQIYKPEQSQIVLAGSGNKESLVTISSHGSGDARHGSPRSHRSGSGSGKFPVRIAPPPPAKRKSEPSLQTIVPSTSFKSTTPSRAATIHSPSNMHNSVAAANIPPPNKNAAEVSSLPPSATASFVKKKDKEKSSGFLKKLMKTKQSPGGASDGINATHGRFRVIAPYPPQSDAELELKVGDTVFVHKKRDDGWYQGTLQRTGRTGLFPGSFVEHF
ncbi:E3 ubiquitin-protein ligase SH3RF3-like isoform X2 [Ptychodera flava]|uniref:E3 ubiquitin-protein ligase SH3RF3-like isoform X2 n=1 Tax=Ptychodera flava TaxID=63121 RepID=UPI00396A42E7